MNARGSRSWVSADAGTRDGGLAQHTNWPLSRVVLALITLVALAAGCGGDSGAGGGEARMLGPTSFAEAVAEPTRVTINVHVPDEGSIDGTDLWVPFDEISARADELPPPSTPLAVYCRSGSMSAEAVEALTALGFTDVVELRGGMLAWRDVGRPLDAPSVP